MSDVGKKAGRAARRAEDSDTADHAARVGLIAYGFIHLVFAWLAAQLAFGSSSGEASGTGALQVLAREPLGELVLWLIAGGMGLMTLWALLDVVTAARDKDGADLWRRRATDVGKAVVYGVLAYSAVSAILGASSGSSDQSSQSLTARLLDLPGGQVVVGAIAIGILVTGAVFVRRGLDDSYMKKIDGDGRHGATSRAYRVLGTVGHVAKGLTIGTVGVLFGIAAIQHDPSESGSTDQALRTLQDQPFGPYVLLAMAAGIAAFGLFCFARARHVST